MILVLRDLINWMINAAKESVNNSKDVEYPKKEDNCLKYMKCSFCYHYALMFKYLGSVR